MTAFGIVSKYARHEATAVALQVAKFLESRGEDVSFFSPNHVCSEVDRQWDSRVITKTRFTDWAREQDIVIWTDVPDVPKVAWLHKYNIGVAVLLRWTSLQPMDREALNGCDCVICPNFPTYMLMTRWAIPRALLIPWIGQGIPCHKPHDYTMDRVRLFMPLWDGNPRRTEITALDILGRTMYARGKVDATVAYSSSTLASAGKRRLRKLKQVFGDRLQLLRSVHPEDRPAVYQRHDLTIWPAHCESFGLPGLTSLTAGTPVIGFNAPPMNSVLSPAYSVKVRCKTLMRNDLGVPIAVPDYDQMDDLLYNLVADSEYLRELQHNTLPEQLERQKCFDSQLGLALGLEAC